MAKGNSDAASAAKRNFAKRLKASRISAGYDTQKEMAAAIGAEEATYGRWERGETEPPFHMLINICEVVNKSLDFLIRNISIPDTRE